MPLERIFLDQNLAGVEFRAAKDDKRAEISGLGAIYYDGTERTEYVVKFSTWTLRERIMPGAFDAVMSNDVRGLFNHDPNMILGRTTAKTLALSLADEGLRYNIDVPDTNAGRDTSESIRRKDVTGSSFSFKIAKDGQRFIETDTEVIREITEFENLFDVGPVTFPAYQATSADSRDFEDIKREIEDARSAGVTARISRAKRIVTARKIGLSR